MDWLKSIKPINKCSVCGCGYCIEKWYANDRPISHCASYRSSRSMHSCRRSLKSWMRRRREETPCCTPWYPKQWQTDCARESQPWRHVRYSQTHPLNTLLNTPGTMKPTILMNFTYYSLTNKIKISRGLMKYDEKHSIFPQGLSCCY